MGGNRARGALATLALSTVVLVAVVLAGNVSLPPLPPLSPDSPPAPGQGQERSSFEVVDDVVIPGDTGTAPSQTDGEQPPGQSDPDSEVVIVIGPSAADDVGLPPSPFGPDLPEPPGPGVENPDAPLGPITPPSFNGPDEPPVIVDPDPPTLPDRPTTGDPDVVGKDRDGKAKGPKTKDGKDKTPKAKKGKGEGKKGHRAGGPRWRPKPPARQDHPTKPGKWSRAEPHPRQYKAHQGSGRSSSAKKSHHPRPHRAEARAPRGNGRGHGRGRGHSRGHGRGHGRR